MNLMLDGLIPRLEAWVQEELNAQRQILDNLKGQERAIQVTDLDSLDTHVQDGRNLRAGSEPLGRSPQGSAPTVGAWIACEGS
jgi:hypothetical protein